jgi:hypothetical protein
MNAYANNEKDGTTESNTLKEFLTAKPPNTPRKESFEFFSVPLRYAFLSLPLCFFAPLR